MSPRQRDGGCDDEGFGLLQAHHHFQVLQVLLLIDRRLRVLQTAHGHRIRTRKFLNNMIRFIYRLTRKV